MVPDTKQLWAAAMKLSPEERAALAGSLLESLEEPQIDPDAEALWEKEVARRLREIDNGTARMVPWTKVRRSLRK